MKEIYHKKNYYFYESLLILISIIGLIFANSMKINNNIINSDFISYSIGYQHSCYITQSYNMKCFGWNIAKQLGLGDLSDNKGDQLNEMGSNLAIVNPGTIDNAKFKSVDCGQFHTCSILTNNKAKCFGNNDYGRLGIGSSNTGDIGNTGNTLPFIDFGDTDNIKPILFSVGQFHACALFDNKKVKCFGKGGEGQLGYENGDDIGSDPSHMGNNLPFVNFGTDVLVSSVHSFGGAFYNCIIIDISQLMKCWGFNYYYQLGYNDTINRGDTADSMGDKLPTLNLGTESKVLQASVGTAHTCAIRIDKELRCWGNNGSSRLGLGTTTSLISTSSPEFIAVKIDSDTTKKVKYVSTGFEHTCVLLDDELSAKCIGKNNDGQLGQGDNIPRGDSPTNTMDTYSTIDLGTGSLKIKTIDAGGQYSCVVFEDFTVKCFGAGNNGKLGSGSPSPIGTSPSQMGNNLKFVDIFSTSSAPTKNPTNSPTAPTPINPTKNPTKNPTNIPTKSPTNPTKIPTKSPTKNPTKSPTNPTKNPTKSPSFKPTKSPQLLECQYTNQKKCKKDIKCMWKSIKNSGECIVVDCNILDKKNCKLRNDICNWKKNICVSR